MITVPSFAVSNDDWSKVWESNDAEAGIIMFVGSNETERNFSWYSDYESSPGNRPTVTISTNKDLSSPQVFEGRCVKPLERVVDDTTIIGDFVNKVTVTGLKENTTYYYQCKSVNYRSEIYSFKTDGGAEFSAMYVTDVHITEIDDENENSLSDTSYRFHQTLEDALSKNENISLLLSAGDQNQEHVKRGRNCKIESDFTHKTEQNILQQFQQRPVRIDCDDRKQDEQTGRNGCQHNTGGQTVVLRNCRRQSFLRGCCRLFCVFVS